MTRRHAAGRGRDPARGRPAQGRDAVDTRAGPADAAVVERFIPALASLLAVAIDRESLEREALEAESLRRSDAIKTTVLRAVSHDLRSPLTAIVAAAGGLANRGARSSTRATARR